MGGLAPLRLPHRCSGAWLPSTQLSVLAGDMMSSLLLSAMGVGGKYPLQKDVYTAGLRAQIWDTVQ